MGIVTSGMNISTDGCCDHNIGNPSEELMDITIDLFSYSN